jgi:hypothetical protein
VNAARTLFIAAFLLAGGPVLLLPGCDDDATGPRQRQDALAGSVIDAAGQPVADAPVGLAYDVMLELKTLERSPGGDEMAGDAGRADMAGDAGGGGMAVVADDPLDPPPVDFQVRYNFPNPFCPSTRIDYALPQVAQVTLTVLDRDSLAVRTLVQGALPAGHHTVTWDGLDDEGSRLLNDCYFARLVCQDEITQEILGEDTGGAMLLNCSDPDAIIPLATTDAGGRFEIPFAALPISWPVPLRDEVATDLGSTPIPSHVLLLVRSDEGTASRWIDLGDLDRRIEVEVQIGSP